MTNIRLHTINEALETDMPAADALEHIRAAEGQHGTLGPQWQADEIARAQRHAADATYIEYLARKDFGTGRFDSLHTGDMADRRAPFDWTGLAIAALGLCVVAGLALIGRGLAMLVGVL